MPNPSFLQDLSEGIFGRLGELRQQKETEDEKQKGQLINMLAGMADRIEPESLPLLMGHLGELTGINKNKEFKTFWGAFSGLPSESMSQQLGSKFREITSGMVGPQTAKDIRLRGNIAQKGISGLVQAAPTGAYGQKAAADVEGLKGKMVFRDPYQQKLEEIEARYGAQLQNQRAMQEERNMATIQRLIAEHGLREQTHAADYERRTNLAIDQVAKLYMNHPGVLAAPVDKRVEMARELARQSLGGERDIKVEDIQSRIKLRGQIGAAKEAEARAGGSPAVQLSRQRREDTLDAARRKLESEISDAKATFDTLSAKMPEHNRKLTNLGKMAGGVTAEQLISAPEGTFFGPVRKAIDEYKKDIRDKNKAEATLNTKKKQLEEFDKSRAKGVTQATPPTKPVPPTRGVLGNVGTGSGSRNLKPGESAINIEGKGQVMPGMVIPSKIDPNLKYRVTYVHPSGKVAYGMVVKE